MTPNLVGTAALVTGASSGIGAASARQLAEHGASVALVARRRDRLEALAAEIEKAGGSSLVVEADITNRAHAEDAVQQTVERFGRLDILVNNAGLMLLGPVVGADTEEWDRMIAINVQGLLYTTCAALPHLLQAAEEGPRRGRRHRQHQLDRRPRRVERLRRLQPPQVRRERVHRVSAAGGNPESRPRRGPRAGWRGH
jgi:NAD(P)-dependent dehydrogenase (short-subunit alcohol dehydrogenase family)